MSDTTEPSRDDATGQFAPSTEGLYGRELQLVEAGYHPRKDPSDEQIAPDYLAEAGDDPIRQAAAELTASREEPFELSPAEFIRSTVEIDPKEAITVQQAADDLASAGAELSRYVEGADLYKIAEEIDQRHEEAIKGDPELAKHYGIEDPKDAPKAKAESVDAATADAIDATDGLTPRAKEYLKDPQIRAAIEQDFAEAAQVREQYSTSLHQGQQMLQATVAALAPQLNGMPLEHWPQAIQMLSQVDPVRANLVADTLQNWGAIQEAQQEQQQRQAYAQHQQFEASRREYSRAADAALGPMTVAEKHEMVEDLVNYVGEYGISRQQFAREAETNLALHHPAFQRMAADAVRYQRLTKSPAKAAPKSLPPVNRPGTAPATPRGSAPSAKMQALEAQLSTARGDRAVRIASQIESLRRKA